MATRWLGVVGAMLVGAAAVTCGAQDPAGPKRLMVFRGPGTVVRESAEKITLAGKGSQGVPALVVGSEKSAGPQEKFENDQIAKAANVLAKYLEKIAGVQCAVVGPEAAAGLAGRKIYLGDPQGMAVRAFAELKNVDGQGFLITTRGSDLHIVGVSGVGTLYGVWFFLQNYCDLRIVMPGELGEVIPKTDRIEIPRELYVLNPGPEFLLRIHSLNNGFDGSAWLADFSGSTRFEYHHNTPNIYDPVTFGKTHPEYYPILRGKRFIPAVKVSGWQPTFSEPAVVQRAVEYADEQFRANPALKSISLTPGDGAGWSEIDQQKAKAEGKTMADIYYEYVNAVAREVKRRWPDRYVAFLRYHFKETPALAMEDNCMLFAMEFAGNPHQVLEQWKDKVRHFGIYQWIYGNSFAVPNHWPHAIQDYLKLVRQYGARALKTEFYDAYAHGGARLWVLNNLLWDTGADVDALLADYFEHAYGKPAAPAMTRYWAQWEAVYQRRRTATEFNLCMFPGRERQFKDITDRDLELMDAALQEAARKAVDPADRQRVDMTARLFENSRRYYLLWRQLKTLNEYPEACADLKDAETRLATANALLECERAVVEWRYQKIEPAAMYCAVIGKGASNGPWLPNYLRLDPRLLYVYGDGKWVKVDQAINRIVQTITARQADAGTPERALAYWADQAKGRPSLRAYAESERLRLLHPNAVLANLLPNGSFEKQGDPQSAEAKAFQTDLKSLRRNWVDADHCQIFEPVCPGWNVLANRPYGKTEVALDRTVKRQGEASLRVKANGQFGGVITHTVLPTPQARYRLSFWYRGVGAGYGLMFDRIRHLPYLDLKLPAAKEWTRFETEIPFNWPLMPDETGDMTLWLGIMHADSEVWFDDVRMELLSPAELDKTAK